MMVGDVAGSGSLKDRAGSRRLGRAAGRAALIALAALAVLPGNGHAASRRGDRELESRLRQHIEILASDEFGGREPGTDGEAATLRYLGKQWFDIGLVSGTNDPGHEWFAPVSLVAREPASSSAQFVRGARGKPIEPAEILVLTSGKRAMVRSAPLLFVGRGDMGELTRNELAGRVAVLLDSASEAVADSELASGDGTGGEGADEGQGATSQRQSALLAMGAAAVLTVLDGERTIEGIEARRLRSGYALSEDSVGGDLEAFISPESMDALLAGTGTTLAGLVAQAGRDDFRPLALDIEATLEATTRARTIHTHNLIGKLPGRHPEAGAVLFLAHWDHFGTCAEAPAEDTVCNGAIDNASGVAALTEIARRLAKGSQLDRDVYFLSTSAEELGLLGAHAFAENPPLPLDQIVAAFNIDSNAIAPRGTPFAIVGRGMTGLDEAIATVAKKEGFRLRDDDEANEYVRRQDGWALLQHDIPAVMVTTAYGEIERIRAFFEGDYHRPSDDATRKLELGGEVEDIKLLTALGRWFADLRRTPQAPGE
ncbi:M28 family peptidase [Novosphingobium sp. YJ-S2-02]|uniref:M28 family peptidase n=1 Tax=Novosphingobium aureum TaxID=2792964 RepID=A0A931HBB6_9SPHN|nr:M28 family peptidase [Novosphingobium aureum]MBH0112850.1 M28 family peptidase [Novosphingobium aureum]